MSTLHGGNADSVMLAALFCATSILGKMEAIGILPLVGDLTTPSNKHGDIRVIKINPDGFQRKDESLQILFNSTCLFE